MIKALKHTMFSLTRDALQRSCLKATRAVLNETHFNNLNIIFEGSKRIYKQEKGKYRLASPRHDP